MTKANYKYLTDYKSSDFLNRLFYYKQFSNTDRLILIKLDTGCYFNNEAGNTFESLAKEIGIHSSMALGILEKLRNLNVIAKEGPVRINKDGRDWLLPKYPADAYMDRCNYYMRNSRIFENKDCPQYIFNLCLDYLNNRKLDESKCQKELFRLGIQYEDGTFNTDYTTWLADFQLPKVYLTETNLMKHMARFTKRNLVVLPQSKTN